MTVHSAHISRIQATLELPSFGQGGDTVARSWRRSAADFKIDPAKGDEPQVLTDVALSILLQEREALIEAARPEVDRLYHIVQPTRYLPLLTDPDGIVIDHRGVDKDAEEFRRFGMWLGRNWAESVEGTNAIGTALLDSQPVTVHCSEHFRLRHAGLSCSGAPIFDWDGSLAGLIDVSSFDPNISARAHTLTGALTIAVARGIGERLFRSRFQKQWVIVFARPDKPDRAALLAVDRDRRIVAANRDARLLMERWSRSEPCESLWDIFARNDSVFRIGGADDRSVLLRSLADGDAWPAIVTPPLSGFAAKVIGGGSRLHLRPRADQLLAGTQPEPAELGPGLSDSLLRRIRDYVEEHLDSDVSLRALSRVAGLSEGQFSRSFRQAENLTPHTYVLKRRVARACRLLRESSLSLADIALAAGFADQSHFARRFRQQTGVTPRQFRKRRCLPPSDM